jgi:hypothetical protein
VKLLFMLELPEETGVEQVERMWVEVKSASGGRYTGRLMNEPVTAHELRSGADVEFGPEHIAAFLYYQAEIGYDLDGMVFVSVRVLERRTRPAELYYEKPTDRRDSGWHPEIEAALRDPRPGWWVWDDREAAYVHQRR